jgi:hypothetical protein
VLKTVETSDEEETEDDEGWDYTSSIEYYFRWRSMLCQREHQDDEFTRALKRAMVFESTVDDLDDTFGLTDFEIDRMFEYQAEKTCPEEILKNWFNWFFTEETTTDAMRRARFHQSTMEDLTGYFLLSPWNAGEVMRFQKHKRENTSRWEAIMNAWKESGTAETPEIERAVSCQSTVSDLMGPFGFSCLDAIDMMAYQRTLRVEKLKQSWFDTLKIMELVDGDLECQKAEVLKRAIAGQATREDLEYLQVPEPDMILDHQIACTM